MFDEAWRSVMRLQAKYDTLVTPSIIWVLGTGCKLDDTEKWEASLSAWSSNTRRTVIRCEENYPLAVMHTAAALVKPLTTKYVESVLCTVKREISICGNVLLLGTSYGGMIAGMVSDRLKDDTRARERLHVRTFGSMYTPTPTGIDVIHFVFTGDEQCMRTNGLRAPEEPVTGTETVRYDLETHVMWLYTYMAPDHKAPWYDPLVLNNMSTKIHLAYIHFMKQVLAFGERLSDPFGPMTLFVSKIANNEAEKEYGILLQSA